MRVLYGIKNCDSVKKARAWLDQQHIEYQFHDFRTDGLSATLLNDFVQRSDWQQLLNRRSTTWKELPPNEREDLDLEKACGLMLANPTLIKRPVLQTGDQLLIGFDPVQYHALLTP